MQKQNSMQGKESHDPRCTFSPKLRKGFYANRKIESVYILVLEKLYKITPGEIYRK